jgi:hypothetical protein
MIVEAYLSESSLGGLASGEVMFLPAGRSTIQARVGGKPKELEVNVAERSAEILQADLAKLLAGKVAPYIDFDHEGKAPKSTTRAPSDSFGHRPASRVT